MKRQKLQNAYEKIRPDEKARERMLENILSKASEISPVGKDDTMKHKRMNPMVLVALIALVAAMTVTAFASEEIAGWFKQYFARNSENGLSTEQIHYLDENEQILGQNQTRGGYDLKMKSVLSDSSTVYITIGISAPSDVTMEDLKNLWGSDIDFYDEHKKPCAAWTMDVFDDMDGLDHTADLIFEMNPADWNSGNIWTLRIDSLSKLVHNEKYERELLKTKYAGQENFMFTDEEAARINQTVLLADGPWEFIIDLSEADREVLELITEPVTVQVRSGMKDDGTYLLEEVYITSVELSPLAATVQTDTDYAPDLTAGDHRIYAVMKDETRIALISNWGVGGKQHFNAETPIILEDVAYILLGDGAKLAKP